MVSRKKVAVIAAAEYINMIEQESASDVKKVKWTDRRVGWHHGKSRAL